MWITLGRIFLMNIRIDLKLSTFQHQTKNARQRSASNR